jgi:hypothetical protein
VVGFIQGGQDVTVTGKTEAIGIVIRSNKLAIASAFIGAVASFSAAWALLGHRVSYLEEAHKRDEASLREVQRGVDRLLVDMDWLKANLPWTGRAPSSIDTPRRISP